MILREALDGCRHEATGVADIPAQSKDRNGQEDFPAGVLILPEP